MNAQSDLLQFPHQNEFLNTFSISLWPIFHPIGRRPTNITMVVINSMVAHNLLTVFDCQNVTMAMTVHKFNVVWEEVFIQVSQEREAYVILVWIN